MATLTTISSFFTRVGFFLGQLRLGQGIAADFNYEY